MAAPTVDRYLRCPLQVRRHRCAHTEWVSDEDEDTSLSLMHGHIRWRHPRADPAKALARVTLHTRTAVS